MTYHIHAADGDIGPVNGLSAILADNP